MTIDIASLGLRVDSSQVETANDELLQFTKRAADAEKSAEQFGDTTEKVGKKGKEAGSKFDGFSRGVRNSVYTIAGVDPRLRALGNLFSGASGAIIGTAAAVGVLVKAYADGARENDNFARSIEITGNAAGVTTSQLTEMAERIDDVVGTQAKAAQTLAAITASGKVSAENLQRFATVAIEAERTFGVPVEETAKRFADLADKPVEAAREIQKSFNFLTPAILAYASAQEKAGNITAAAAAVQSAYAGAVERATERTRGELNLLGRGWQAVKDFAKEAWDEMSGIGRKSSLPKQIAELENARDRAIGRGFPTGGIENEIERLKKLDAEQKATAKGMAELKASNDAASESFKSATESAEEFADAQKAINQAWAQFDIGKIQRDFALVASQYQGLNDELEAQRAANLIVDERYYARKRELLRDQTDAEIKSLLAQNRELQKQDDLSSVERIAAQNKIAENQARIAELRQSTASKLRVLDTEEQAALKRTSDAYEDARVSAERYVETLARRFRIESEGLGRGQRERDRLTGRADIELQFEERRQQLDDARRRNEITEAEYQKYLEIERDALKRSEELYDEHFQELTEKQGNWLTGFSEALNNFVDDSQNIAKSFEDLFTNAFRGMTDSLVSFATTGKGNFKGLVNSILADLLRIQLQIIASQYLQSVFGGFLSAGGGASSQILSARFGSTRNLAIDLPSGRASGGPVGAGTPYIVGENGPEMFIPNTNGMIAPSGSFGGVNIYSTVNVGAGANVAQFEAALDARDAQLKSDIFSNIKNGRWGRAQ